MIRPNKTEYNHVRKRMWRKKKKLDEKYIEKVLTRKLRDKIRDEVERIYLDEQVSYCLPDMKYAGY